MSGAAPHNRGRDSEQRTREWVVPLPYDRPPLSMNQRLHWRRKAEIAAKLRADTRWCVRAAKVPPLARCSVTLHWAPGDNRRRDEDNLVATAKVCADAVVDEGVVRDDVPALMVKPSPVIHQPSHLWYPARVWLVIAEVTG